MCWCLGPLPVHARLLAEQMDIRNRACLRHSDPPWTEIYIIITQLKRVSVNSSIEWMKLPQTLWQWNSVHPIMWTMTSEKNGQNSKRKKQEYKLNQDVLVTGGCRDRFRTKEILTNPCGASNMFRLFPASAGVKLVTTVNVIRKTFSNPWILAAFYVMLFIDCVWTQRIIQLN